MKNLCCLCAYSVTSVVIIMSFNRQRTRRRHRENRALLANFMGNQNSQMKNLCCLCAYSVTSVVIMMSFNRREHGEGTEKTERFLQTSWKINNPEKKPGRVVFFDAYGRKVKELSYLKKIGIQDLNYGIYYILVVDVKDRIVMKDKFIRQ